MLDYLKQIDHGVKAGQITGGGMMQLPAKGEAILFDADLHVNNGNTFLSFFLTLPCATDYRRFQLRLPSQTDKQSAQYLGMQRVYSTLFGAIKADPKTELITDVWERFTQTLLQNSIKVNYETEERSFVSQRDGKEIKTAELITIQGIALVARVQISVLKPSEKAATTTPSAASWGSETSTFGADVPF